MRYAAKRKQDISVSTTPLEVVIPLEQPVKIYSAKELAAMPLFQVKEKSRIRYKINNEFIPLRIIRQLEMRGLVKLERGK